MSRTSFVAEARTSGMALSDGFSAGLLGAAGAVLAGGWLRTPQAAPSTAPFADCGPHHSGDPEPATA